MGRNGMFMSESHKSYQGAAASNVLLTWVPHEKTHGPMAINKKMLEATTNVSVLGCLAELPAAERSPEPFTNEAMLVIPCRSSMPW